MSIELYYLPVSAPCRIVLLVAAALDVQLNLNLVDLMKGEHLTPDFLKINPQHTVPTIVDGDLSLWESRAISRYIINKYAPDSSLYPQDVAARALVDQRVDFDIGTLYPRFAQYFYPIIFAGSKPDEAAFKKLEDALGFLNIFLEGHKFAVGGQLTLADLSLVATVSTIEAAEISLKPYPNVERWLKLVKTTAPKYEEANQKGINDLKKMVQQKKLDKSDL